LPGRGITAVSSGGEGVAIGSRQLLLAEGVSAAPAEDVARAIERQGRTAVFVAIAGRVEGVLGFRDPLRDEARPSVQALMDAGFDLALLGGESRGTVEAIGALLDVGNLRPEVPPDERASAVRSIAEFAGAVAVVGSPKRDGAALSAADVAISLAAAGGTGGETAVALASDDLRDAASALAMARAAHRRALRRVAFSASAALASAGLCAAIPAFGALGAIALGASVTALGVLAGREAR
jgi:Cu+-exporting ATPase